MKNRPESLRKLGGYFFDTGSSGVASVILNICNLEEASKNGFQNGCYYIMLPNSLMGFKLL